MRENETQPTSAPSAIETPVPAREPAARNVIENRSDAPVRENEARRLESERIFHDQAFSANVRAQTDGFYSITQSSWRYFIGRVEAAGRGKRALEYGCGPGILAFPLARVDAEVVGIDISDVAIAQAQAIARREGVAERTHFEVMNAESLSFVDRSFDLVCGTGILHHLDLERSFAEIVRVLKPDGVALFCEPLGHNPLINLYRRLTPDLRTADEHPLVQRDFDLAHAFFRDVKVRAFHLLTLAASPLRNSRLFQPVLSSLERADSALFRHVGPARRWAWMAVLELSGPRHSPPGAARSSAPT